MPSIPTTVTQPELPGVGVGPGRKFSPNTELILSQRWQPGLWLERLLLCGFEIPESLRARDPGMVSPEYLLEPAVGLGGPPLSALKDEGLVDGTSQGTVAEAKLSGPKLVGRAWGRWGRR